MEAAREKSETGKREKASSVTYSFRSLFPFPPPQKITLFDLPKNPNRDPPIAHGIARISRLIRLAVAIGGSFFIYFGGESPLILRRTSVPLRLRMNWFVNLGLNSNSNHFVTCLLIFILHYSPQLPPSILNSRSRWSCDPQFWSHGESL